MESRLHTLHTGLFVESDKSSFLLYNINALLRTKYRVKAVSGPILNNGKREIVFHSLQSTGSDYASAKAALEHYFAMIKEARPHFVIEKKPELIDLDEELDLSVIFVGNVETEVREISVIDLDCSEQVQVEENDPKTEGKSNDSQEVICLEDDETPTSPLVSTLEDNKTNNSYNSLTGSDKCIIAESSSVEINQPTVSSLESNVIDMSVLKESNHQMQVKILPDSIKNFEIVEIPDDDVDMDTSQMDTCYNHMDLDTTLATGCILSSKKQQKIDEEKSDTLIPDNCSNSKEQNPTTSRSLQNSNEISKSVEVLTNTFQNMKQAVASIISTESPPKKSCPAKKRKKATKMSNAINILDIPEPSSTNTRPAKKSKLSYKKPAHLVKPLVQKVTEGGEVTGASSDAQYNMYNPNAGLEEKKTGLRPIVIDGNNVGVGHGKGVFSMKGIQICVNFFEMKGHRQIKVFLPQYRKNKDNHDLIHSMERQGTLVITPSRRVDGKVIASYDDRYIVQYAAACGGVIISTDNYRDLMHEDPSWTDTIKNRLLMFTWVDENTLMFPQDPLGRYGPNLRQFLQFPD